MPDLETRLRKLVSDHLCVEEDRITPQASFVDDLRADSIDTIELSMAVEEEFGIELSDDEAATAIGEGAFGDLLALIGARLAGRAAA